MRYLFLKIKIRILINKCNNLIKNENADFEIIYNHLSKYLKPLEAAIILKLSCLNKNIDKHDLNKICKMIVDSRKLNSNIKKYESLAKEIKKEAEVLFLENQIAVLKTKINSHDEINNSKSEELNYGKSENIIDEFSQALINNTIHSSHCLSYNELSKAFKTSIYNQIINNYDYNEIEKNIELYAASIIHYPKHYFEDSDYKILIDLDKNSIEYKNLLYKIEYNSMADFLKKHKNKESIQSFAAFCFNNPSREEILKRINL